MGQGVRRGMNPATDINTKRQQSSEKGSAAMQLRSQMIVAELPDLFKKLGKQNQAVFTAIKEQTAVVENQLKTEINQRDWTERLHGRLDALAIEGRVTNMLLAELVAAHKTMAGTIEHSSEHIRSQAYNRALNGE